MAFSERANLPPEIRFLFLALSASAGQDTPSPRDEWSHADLNWVSLVQTALGQGVAPLLYHQLQKRGISVPPRDFAEQLKKAYFRTAGRNTLYRAGLKEILEAFRAAQVEVIVLKGAALNELVYPNPALRSMTDIDLLVKEAEIQSACATLRSIGYAQPHTMSLEAQQKEFHALRYPFEKPNRPPVDLHWTIETAHKSARVDVEGLWHRATPTPLVDVPALTLCPEDLLLHLCVHLSYHHKFAVAGIRSLCDITQTIRRFGPELDWPQFAQRAVAWHVSNSAYLSLFLAKMLLCAAVPADTLNRLRSKDFSDSLVTAALARLLSDPAQREWELSYNVLTEMWAAERPKDRAAIFLKRVFISPEAIAARYPVSPGSVRAYLWYPVWFAQEGSRLGKYLWRRLRGDQRSQSFINLNDWLEAD